jgi:hypothetical protein
MNKITSNNNDINEILAKLAKDRRIVTVAGLPGVGKSLYVQKLVEAANALHRAVFLLQWDVSRRAFDTPDVLQRYPEIDGVTSAIIRRAAGQWCRDAVLSWHRKTDSHGILLIEAPLVGNRFVELMMPLDDAAESLLGSDEHVVVLPVPSLQVRAAIEQARARTIAEPTHVRENADAPPNVVRALWRELGEVARELKITGSDAADCYQPDTYRTVYQHLLRFRRTLTLEVTQVRATERSVYELPPIAGELTASATEVARQMNDMEMLADDIGACSGAGAAKQIDAWHEAKASRWFAY